MAFRLATTIARPADRPHALRHGACADPLPAGARLHGITLHRLTSTHYRITAMATGLVLGTGEPGTHHVDGPHVHLYVDQGALHYLITREGAVVSLSPGRHTLRAVLAGPDHCEYIGAAYTTTQEVSV